MAESLAFYRLKDLPVKQHHEVKLRHKISGISKLTKHIMLKTAGEVLKIAVNLPFTLQSPLCCTCSKSTLLFLFFITKPYDSVTIYICCCSLLLCLCKKFLSCLIGIKYCLNKLFFRRLARNISPLNNACRLMCNGRDIFFCQSYLS